MAIDERLAKKGQGQPRSGLVEQGKVTVALARQYATQLASAGWSKADTTAMDALVTELEADIATQAENRAGAHDAHRGEQAAIDDAKTFIRLLDHALPRVLRTTHTGLTAADFAAGGPLARSVPKISGYLAKIRSHVAALESELKKPFGGKSALEQLDTVKSELDAADTQHHTSSTSLPADTAALNEAKGKLLEAIEDCNRAGKIAFDGDATKVSMWNKDVLMRARKTRKATEPAPAPTPPAPEKLGG
jgi:hypothetical protein